jgi:Putative  PD-(D/E)XK family member, (DUF4420)
MRGVPTELERAWAVLAPPRLDEFASYPLDISFDGRPCRVAVDRSGARHLLIPATGEALSDDDRGSTLAISVRRLGFGTDVTEFVDLACMDVDLQAEFDDVILDVLDAVSAAELPGAAALASIRRWRRLFRNRLVRGLSRQARIGLFAELGLLSAMLDIEPTLTADIWRGPLREPHDFELIARCVEVKAVASSSEAIIIHGLRQLDTHGDRPLDLSLVEVVTDPNGTRLADIIDAVLAKSQAEVDLQRRLELAGWFAASEALDVECFSVGSVLVTPVTVSTPRIVPSSLPGGEVPLGISAVTYELSREVLAESLVPSSLVAVARRALA